MKKFLTACGLMSVLILTTLAAASALPNYAGTWVLDKQKSKGLPPMMMEGTESIELTVKQDEQNLTIKSNLPGGGDEVAYKLDGSKSKVQVGGRMPGEATIYLEKKDDGKIVLHMLRELNIQGNAINITITESWELADNGKTLKTKRTMESPRGTQEWEMLFTLKS